MTDYIKEKLFDTCMDDEDIELTNEMIGRINFLNSFGDCKIDEVCEEKKKIIHRLIIEIEYMLLELCQSIDKDYYRSLRFNMYLRIHRPNEAFMEYVESYDSIYDEIAENIKILTDALDNMKKLKVSDIGDLYECINLLYICYYQDQKYHDYHMLNKNRYVDDGIDVYDIRREKDKLLLQLKASVREIKKGK